MFRKPIFWILLVVLNVIAIYYIYNNLPRAFSALDIETTMSRSGSLQAADSLHAYLSVELDDYKQATMFTNDSWFQNYVELRSGGKEVFREILKGDDYEPYYWYVRHFREGETRELGMWFAPNGKVLGFQERVPEGEVGTALSREEAKVIADSLARYEWLIDLDRYELIESAQEERPNGRIDHTFTYEMSDISIGEAFYRLRMVVSGDRLTTIRPITKIPDSFYKEYQEMRSFNNTLALVATALAALLYGSILIVWLIKLVKKRDLLLKPALKWVILIGVLYFISDMNYFALYWFGYDTSTSAGNFIFQIILQTLISTLFLTLINFLTIVIAESVTRQAFPEKVQFWQMTAKDVAPTKRILGYVTGSYLIVPLFMALTVSFYIFSGSRWGWWFPSSALSNPNILGALSPVVSVIGISLWAGFFEEAMFRALPLATAVIIGVKLKKRMLFLIIGLIVQAFIFSAVHANYPQQPYYARLVELLVPSFMFAFLYLKFGLLPAILVHFFYNAVWGSLGFFTMQASGLWLDRTVFVFLFFLPLLFVFYRRWQDEGWRSEEKGSFLTCITRFLFLNWRELPEQKLNRSYSELSENSQEESLPATEKLSSTSLLHQEEKTSQPCAEKRRADDDKTQIREKKEGLALWKALVLTLVILLSGVFVFIEDGREKGFPEPRLEITSKEAVEIADNALLEWLGAEIPASYSPYPGTFASSQNTRFFTLSRNGIDDYGSLIDNYIFEDSWQIHYKRFDGDLRERIEQYRVDMTSRGDVYNIRHQVAEEEPGADLSEEEARRVVMTELSNTFGSEYRGFREVSSVPRKLSNRTDWVFVYADTLSYSLAKGQPRISIEVTGDKVSNFIRFIHIPEEESRHIRSQSENALTISILAYILFALFISSGLAVAFIKWTRKEIDLSSFRNVVVAMVFLSILNTIVNWRMSIGRFNTTEPFSNQLIGLIIGVVLQTVFLSGFYALIIGFCRNWQKERQPSSNKLSVIGIILAGGLVFLTTAIRSEAVTLFHILEIPDFNPALSASSVLALFVSMTKTYLLYFGLLSYLFFVVDKLVSQKRGNRIWSCLIFIFAGLVLSYMRGLSYLTAPYTWLIPIRGIVLAIFFYLLYVLTTRIKDTNLIPVSILLFSVVPIVGIIRNHFVGAIVSYSIAYILSIMMIILIFKSSKKRSIA